MADCTDYILNRRCRIVARLCGRRIYDDSGECVATIRGSDVVRMRDDKILGEYVKGRFRERRSSPAGEPLTVAFLESNRYGLPIPLSNVPIGADRLLPYSPSDVPLCNGEAPEDVWGLEWDEFINGS